MFVLRVSHVPGAPTGTCNQKGSHSLVIHKQWKNLRRHHVTKPKKQVENQIEQEAKLDQSTRIYYLLTSNKQEENEFSVCFLLTTKFEFIEQHNIIIMLLICLS